MQRGFTEEEIKKINEEYAEESKAFYDYALWKNGKWIRENRERHRLCVKKYSESEKGKEARRKAACIRTSRVNATMLSKKEKNMILEFYLDCPEGYEVDHIIPLSKCGKHELANLQHMKKEENRKKSSNIYNNLNETPHCIINVA